MKQSLSKSLSNIGWLLKPYRLVLLLCGVLCIVSVCFTVAAPLVLAKTIDLILTGADNENGINFPQLTKLLSICAVLYIVSTSANAAVSWCIAGISNKIGQTLRDLISEKINRLPMMYFDTHRSGDTLALLTNDVNVLTMALNQGLPQVFAGTLTIAGILVIMFATDWLMSLVVLAIIPLSALILPGITSRSQESFRKLQNSTGTISALTEETLGSHFIVKSCNREDAMLADFDKVNKELEESAQRSLFYSGLIMPLTFLTMNCGYVLLCIAGGLCVIYGRITIGGIQAFIQYSNMLMQPLGQLASIAGTAQQMLAATERLTVLAEEPDEPIVSDPVFIKPVSPKTERGGEIRFENVRFGYHKDKPLIKDFSLIIKAGQKAAIVGPTGAGKTTLVKLLLRFYSLDGGRIFVNGMDITAMSHRNLREHFAMVLQETWIYNDTIRNNIRYAVQRADDAAVEQAAKITCTDSFIRTLPGGYDMELTEGADNISQGQKQLLTIARALMPDPQILILDEATSAVDTYTELQIQRAMNKLMQGRTSLVIAHRLSTIRDADIIIAMNEGDIVETGTHDELLRKNGFYAELYSNVNYANS